MFLCDKSKTETSGILTCCARGLWRTIRRLVLLTISTVCICPRRQIPHYDTRLITLISARVRGKRDVSAMKYKLLEAICSFLSGISLLARSALRYISYIFLSLRRQRVLHSCITIYCLIICIYRLCTRLNVEKKRLSIDCLMAVASLNRKTCKGTICDDS